MLADGTAIKCLTGVDDHSRFCVSALLMPRERTQPVCDAFAAALRTHGVPEQVLTDNGKVFTGRFNHPPTEVLFDRICRENTIKSSTGTIVAKNSAAKKTERSVTLPTRGKATEIG